MFINARIDTHLFAAGSESGRLAEAFLAAGANGIFALDVVDLPAIEALAAKVSGPLNVMGSGAPPAAALASAGATRVSTGPSPGAVRIRGGAP